LEITGRIVPKKAQPESPATTTEKPGGSTPITSADKPAHPTPPSKSSAAVASKPTPTTKSEPSKGEAAKNKKDTNDQKGTATEDVAKEEAAPFLFRTVRVEPDPQLVDQLEAAKVTFKGVRPSFISNFLFAWLLPIGVMLVLWMFLSRGLKAAGQSVMSFGKPRDSFVFPKNLPITRQTTQRQVDLCANLFFNSPCEITGQWFDRFVNIVKGDHRQWGVVFRFEFAVQESFDKRQISWTRNVNWLVTEGVVLSHFHFGEPTFRQEGRPTNATRW
jgi:hypothetical protein